MGGKDVKSVNQYKYLGAVLDTELPDDKDIQRQLRWKYCAANKLRASSPDVQMQLKCAFSFLLYAHVCITVMAEFQKVMHAKAACGL